MAFRGLNGRAIDKEIPRTLQPKIYPRPVYTYSTWPKRTSTLGHRDIERVHVGPRTGFPHDRSGTADMIRVAASEN
jgi:hypothetical protein